MFATNDTHIHTFCSQTKTKESSCHCPFMGFSPCVRDSEAPLLVDVVVEQHATKQTRGVAWRKAGGDGGGRPAVSSWPFWLQQVLPQDLHQVFIQAGVFGHGGHCQGVLVGHPHACLLGHACPGFTSLHCQHQQQGNKWSVKCRMQVISEREKVNTHSKHVFFFGRVQ